MALQSCYECNKEISTKAIICPQCGAPQNPVSGLVDKAKDGFLGKTFNKTKNIIRGIARRKEVKRITEEYLEKWLDADETRMRMVLSDNINYSLADDPLLGNKLIHAFMDEMGIERDSEDSEFPCEYRIRLELFNIKERRKGNE